MHGLGNDFVIVDAMENAIELGREQAKKIADRRQGVGCDQVLQLLPCEDGVHTAHFRVLNSDGSEAEQCGNGMRCLGLYLYERRDCDADAIALHGLAGTVAIRVKSADAVSVDMGVPEFTPAAIPINAPHQTGEYNLEMQGEQITIGAVSIGNPHAVVIVDDVAEAPVARLGPAIAKHRQFPQGANAGFMEIVDCGHIRLRVFERGAGETPACGSGACAAVAVGVTRGLLDAKVRVTMSGGELVVKFNGGSEPVWMTGPAVFVFDGEIKL